MLPLPLRFLPTDCRNKGLIRRGLWTTTDTARNSTDSLETEDTSAAEFSEKSSSSAGCQTASGKTMSLTAEDVRTAELGEKARQPEVMYTSELSRDFFESEVR